MNLEIIYFAGFLDGEGSCIVRFMKDKRYLSGYQITHWINLTQKDKEILIKFQKIFGCGKLYFHKRDQLWHLDIWKRNEIIRVMKQLLPYLVVKKKKATRFLEVIQMMKRKKHLEPKGLEKIHLLWDPKTERNTR